MSLLKKLSIWTKLIVIIIVTGVVIGIGFIIVVTNDTGRFEKNMLKNTIASARLISEDCVTALAFNDSKGARDTLQKLKFDLNILYGFIYDNKGDLFASYSKYGGTIAKHKIEDRRLVLIEKDYRQVVQPMIYQNQRYGTICLIASAAVLQIKIRDYLTTMGLLAAGLIFFSCFLSLMFQKIISRPILELANITQMISNEADYSLRAQKKGEDEISILYDGFNEMLAQIENRSRERDNAMETLRKSEKKYAMLLEQATDAVVIMQDGIIQFNNRAALEIFGYNRKELLGMDFLEIVASEYSELIAERSKSRVESKGIVNLYEMKILCRDGSMKDVEVAANFIQYNGLSATMGVARDITKHKKAENELRKMANIIESASNAIVTSNLEGKMTYANRAFFKKWGFEKAEEFLGRDFQKFWMIEDRLEEIMRALLHEDGIWSDEIRARRKDGAFFDVQVSAATVFDKDGDPVALMSTSTDITERKKAEEALRESEQLLSESQKSANIGSWVWDLKTGITVWSEQLYKIYGRDAFLDVPPMGSNLEDYHPDDREPLQNALEEAVKKDNPYIIEYRIFREDNGKERWIHSHGKLEKDENGKPNRLIGIAHDITERKHAQEALKESEEKFRKLSEVAEEGVLIHEKGFILESNDALTRIFRCKASEMVGKRITRYVTPKSWEIMNEKMTSRRYKSYEFIAVRTDGSTFPCEGTGKSYEFEGKILSVVTLRDITERKQTEEELKKYREHLEELIIERTKELENAHKELIRKEKFATLGQVTATVSHELRNPLGTIHSSLYLIGERVRGKGLGLERALDRADRNINRCDNIIEELLGYTRIGNLNLEKTQIDEWMDKKINEYVMRDNINVVRNFNSGVEIMIDRERFYRCLINIIDNATQAMEERLIEEINNEEKERGNNLIISSFSAKDRLNIQVKDNGPGIFPDEIEKIFEPLYSTKGFGVGLGLPSVKQILEQHGGGVDVESEVGHGTTFTLWLPIDNAIYS